MAGGTEAAGPGGATPAAEGAAAAVGIPQWCTVNTPFSEDQVGESAY